MEKLFDLKKYKKSILLFLFSIIYINAFSFRLDNIVFNQRMDVAEGGYRELYLSNSSLTKKRYKINILKGNKNDGSSFVQVYPKVITVMPKSKGTIKVFAKALPNTKQGEYDFRLQFKPISIPTIAKESQGKIEGTSNVSIAPIIEMKGYVGNIDFEKELTFKNISIMKGDKGIVVKGELSNNAFAGIDFGAEAYGVNNFFYGSVYVDDLPKNIKNKKIELKFPMIENPKDLKKIVFYRTPSNTREVIKEISLEK